MKEYKETTQWLRQVNQPADTGGGSHVKGKVQKNKNSYQSTTTTAGTAASSRPLPSVISLVEEDVTPRVGRTAAETTSSNTNNRNFHWLPATTATPSDLAHAPVPNTVWQQPRHGSFRQEQGVNDDDDSLSNDAELDYLADMGEVSSGSSGSCNNDDSNDSEELDEDHDDSQGAWIEPFTDLDPHYDGIHEIARRLDPECQDLLIRVFL